MMVVVEVYGSGDIYKGLLPSKTYLMREAELVGATLLTLLGVRDFLEK